MKGDVRAWFDTSASSVVVYGLRGFANSVSIDFSLTVKAATLIFISGRVSANPSAKDGESGFIYNLVKS